MREITVIDASIAVKWFLASDPHRDSALAIFEGVRQHPEKFAVPELFYAEMLSVLCRLVSKDSDIKAHFEALEQLGIERIGQGHSVMRRAIEIAAGYKLTGYDAIYAATADLCGGIWITADLKAHRKIASLKISKLLGA